MEKWMIIRITLCQTNTLPKWMSFLNHFFNSSLPLNDYSAAFKYRSPSQQRRPSPSLLSDSYSMPLHDTSLRLKVKTSWLLFNSSKKKCTTHSCTKWRSPYHVVTRPGNMVSHLVWRKSSISDGNDRPTAGPATATTSTTTMNTNTMRSTMSSSSNSQGSSSSSTSPTSWSMPSTTMTTRKMMRDDPQVTTTVMLGL